jgi:hypothetical protein
MDMDSFAYLDTFCSSISTIDSIIFLLQKEEKVTFN